MDLCSSNILRLYVLFFIVQGLHALPNLECHPRPEVVATTKDSSFRYFPYFVQLYRCAGSKGKTSPIVVHCVADQTDDIFINVSQSWPKQKLAVKLQNHTHCKTECVLKREQCKSPAVYDADNCLCSCNARKVGPPGLICRDPRKIWSNEHCACVCKNSAPCQRRRKFNSRTCSCECKNKDKLCDVGRVYDHSICGCRKVSRSTKTNAKMQSDSSNKGLKFWLSAVVIEFLVMLIAFDAFLYANKSGIAYNAMAYVTKETSKKEAVDIKVKMTYTEVLKQRSSLNSSSTRKRSTRNSSVHPISPPFASSPVYDFSNEEVFR